MPVAAPPPRVIDALLAGYVQVTRRVDILTSNGVLWEGSEFVDLLDGSVSVDAGRDERRTLDITLSSTQGALVTSPDMFWYDKLIRPWRGIRTPTLEWEAPLGTFMIDTIGELQRIKPRQRPRTDEWLNLSTDQGREFLVSCQVSGRDFTKKMITSKFSVPTTFVAGTALSAIVLAVAANAGVIAVAHPWADFATPTPLLTFDQTFDAGSSRWECIDSLCLQFGYEAFVDAYGTLVIRPFQDPVLTQSVWTFETSSDRGHLVSYTPKVDDSELFNHVVVRGSGQSNAAVFAEVEITDPDNPNHKDRIGDRVWTYESSVVANNTEAFILAGQFLAVKSLQACILSLGSVALPWLEAGSVVQFIDPDDPNSDLPRRLLLTDFNMPLALGQMDAQAKRVFITTGEVVDPGGGGVGSELSWADDSPPTEITTAGGDWSYFFHAFGDPVPTYSLDGADPADIGLSFNTLTGELSGTPIEGSITFTVTATNASGSITTDSITITVVVEFVSFTAESPDTSLVVGVPFTYTFHADAVPDPTYSIIGDDPADIGLALDPDTGILSGTPTAGSITFQVYADNVYSNDTTASITIEAGTVPVWVDDSPGELVDETPYSYTFLATGTAPIVYSIVGDDPGFVYLALDPDTGELAGSGALSDGSATFKVRATNDFGHVDSPTFNFVADIP